MDPIVEGSLIAAGAAVTGGVIALGATRLQLRSTERLARQRFLWERQADMYSLLIDEVSRIEAITDVAEVNALGSSTDLKRSEMLHDDDWHRMQGMLRVFGNRLVRDDFDSMMAAMRALILLERGAVERGRPADELAVRKAASAIREYGVRLRTTATADVGPLRDWLADSARHWWQFRRRRRDHARLALLRGRGEARSEGPSRSTEADA